MTIELTSQSRGGRYFVFDDGRGAVHETDLTRADRVKLGLEPAPTPAQHEPTDVSGEIDNG